MNSNTLTNGFASGSKKACIAACVLLAACTVMLSACVQVRLLTYPSEFSYLDTKSVKGVMYEMAIGLNHVTELVNNASDTPAKKSAIVSELEHIEQLAISMSTGTSSNESGDLSRPITNHLLIDEHLDDFIDQTMRARQMAQATPANYFAAGQLIGSCNACHRMR